MVGHRGTRKSEDEIDTFIVPASSSHTVRALSLAAAHRSLDVLPLSLASALTLVPSPGRLHLFGGPRLAGRVQQRAPLALLEPEDDWLTTLPEHLVRRRVRLVPALEAYGLQERFFVKMPREKGLEPGPYLGHELPTLPPDEPLLVSDLVTMTDEYRFWLLDGAVHASSSYRIDGRPDARALDSRAPSSLHRFVADLLADQAPQLPSALVVDVAWISQPDPGWAVVEANMAWFSSHYAGDPDRVLDGAEGGRPTRRRLGPRRPIRLREQRSA